jgi:Tfp pilus assembly protein PilX
MCRNAVPVRRRDAGFSLITAVVIVLMVTIVGLSAMTISRSQLQASGNAQYQLAALHEADRGVATAETWLDTGTNAKSAGFATRGDQTPALFPVNYLSSNSLNPLTWTWSDTNSQSLNSGASRYLIEQVANNIVPAGESPRGLIDEEGNTDCKMVNVYRVTARGTSATGASRTVQSVFSVDACS